MPVAAAAAVLGVSERQLRRWLRAGCPVARRGGRGRGRAALVDPAAVSAWRRRSSAEDVLLVLAGEIPELAAAAVAESFRLVEGPHKTACAGPMAGSWYLVCTAILDRLRADAPAVPELRATPEKILRLRQIFRDSGIVVARTTKPEEEPWT